MGTYIQPYFEIDEVSEEVHLRHLYVIRFVNCALSKQRTTKHYRINCHLKSESTANTVFTIGRIIEVNISYSTVIHKEDEILSFYCDLLSRLNDQFRVGLDCMLVREAVLELIKTEECIYSPKKVRSKDKQHSYVLYYTFENSNVLAVGVLIYNSKEEVIHKIRFATLPCGVLVFDILKNWIDKNSWFNQDSIVIYNPNKVDYWLVSLNGEVKFYFQRAVLGDAHGQYDLAMMYKVGRGVCCDLVLYQYWLDKAVAQGYPHAIKEKR